MRTLPLRLSPLEEESLSGYVARYAHTFAFAPGDVVRALGLCSGSVSVKATGRYALALSHEQLQRASLASGIEIETIERMLLARFAGRAFPYHEPDSLATTAGTAFQREVRILRSRYCPGCLREHGTWLIRWQLAWSVVCVRHRSVMLHRCTECGAVPRIPMREGWPKDEQGQLRDPSRCFARPTRHGPLCRASFAAAGAPQAEPALIDAQRRIDTVLDGEHQPALAGERLEPHAYLCDLLALTSLLRRCREQPAPAGRLLLDDPAALASVFPDALRLADLPSRVALAHELRQLGETYYRVSANKLPYAAEIRGMSRALREALGRARNESSWARPSRKLGIDPDAYRRPEDLHPDLQPRHIPQMLWEPTYTPELAEHFNFLNDKDHRARRFCSALLVCMLAPVGFFGAVRYLQLPELFLHAEYVKTFTRLRNHGRIQPVATTLKQIANQQAASGLIDYKQRRTKLAGWAGIDAETWSQAHPRTNAGSHVHASVWLWCKLTSGYALAAPIALPRPDLQEHATVIDGFTPELRDGLLMLGELLLLVASTPPTALNSAP